MSEAGSGSCRALILRRGGVEWRRRDECVSERERKGDAAMKGWGVRDGTRKEGGEGGGLTAEFGRRTRG